MSVHAPVSPLPDVKDQRLNVHLRKSFAYVIISRELDVLCVVKKNKLDINFYLETNYLFCRFTYLTLWETKTNIWCTSNIVYYKLYEERFYAIYDTVIIFFVLDLLKITLQ